MFQDKESRMREDVEKENEGKKATPKESQEKMKKGASKGGRDNSEVELTNQESAAEKGTGEG